MLAARRLLPALAAVVVFLVSGGDALAAGGDYVVEGGSPEAQAQVRGALERSRFDWSVVPVRVTIRITDCGCAGASPGEIVLDERQLTGSPLGPRYAWGLVQHEYAHQVDFFVLDAADRARLSRRFRTPAWCYEEPGVAHDANGCERFATLLAWAYWRSPRNVQRPDWRRASAPPLRRTRIRAAIERLL